MNPTTNDRIRQMNYSGERLQMPDMGDSSIPLGQRYEQRFDFMDQLEADAASKEQRDQFVENHPRNCRYEEVEDYENEEYTDYGHAENKSYSKGIKPKQNQIGSLGEIFLDQQNTISRQNEVIADLKRQLFLEKNKHEPKVERNPSKHTKHKGSASNIGKSVSFSDNDISTLYNHLRKAKQICRSILNEECY